MAHKICLPSDVKYILNMIENSGHSAYVVGGCVRDSLLGKPISDWDIATSASPDETLVAFSKHPTIDIGRQHGTIVVVINERSYDITTFRKDSNYINNRHPGKVEFISCIDDDLKRRDFTINAIAYNETCGLYDQHDGVGDLKNKIIRCIGSADERFREDALRILRAARFASTCSFKIEAETARAMRENKHLLKNISRERIASELNKSLLGDDIYDVFTEHFCIISEILPELIPLYNYSQNHMRCDYDTLAHTLKAIEFAPKDCTIRLALLLHDIARPQCDIEHETTGHIQRFGERSSVMARSILSNLKYAKDITDAVVQLIYYHDADLIASPKSIKRWLNKIDIESFYRLLEVKRAVVMAQSQEDKSKSLSEVAEVRILLDKILQNEECYAVRDLKISGTDLIEIGIPKGRRIGETLNKLVELVINNELENDYESLIKYVKYHR
jgi:tRNA nucleotidyltransferase (CCA-adding enzyme)